MDESCAACARDCRSVRMEGFGSKNGFQNLRLKCGIGLDLFILHFYWKKKKTSIFEIIKKGK